MHLLLAIRLTLSSNSTKTGTGYGLGPKPGWDWLAPFGPVPGAIEIDEPYDANGKLKPQYECTTISKDKCVEDCVNRRAINATRHPPHFELGVYQCNT